MKESLNRSSDEKLKGHLRALGTAIRKLRLQQGLSCTELARKADISKSYLSRIERNNGDDPRGISFAFVFDISTALGIDVADLLNYAQSLEGRDMPI